MLLQATLALSLVVSSLKSVCSCCGKKGNGSPYSIAERRVSNTIDASEVTTLWGYTNLFIIIIIIICAGAAMRSLASIAVASWLLVSRRRRDAEEGGRAGVHAPAALRRRARGHFGDARVSRDRGAAAGGVVAARRRRHRRGGRRRLRRVAGRRHVLFEDQTRRRPARRPVHVHGRQPGRPRQHQRRRQRHL